MIGDRRRGSLQALLAAALSIVSGCGGDNSSPQASAGYFAPLAAMGSPRVFHTATLLQDGRVLVVGGYSGAEDAWYPQKVLATAEIYDPGSGIWSPTGSMAVARAGHAATLLADGKVLVVGGAAYPNASTAEIYDPITGTFTTTGNMNSERDWPVAVRLASGTVLVVQGDFRAGFPATADASEIFDEATGRFLLSGAMTESESGGEAVQLQSGAVLMPGGITSYDIGNSYYAVSELYAPSTGLFSLTGPLTTPRVMYRAVLLQDGSVLVTGGRHMIAHDVDISLSSAEVFDPTTQMYGAVADLRAARALHSATVLQSGEVLIAGGVQGGGAGFPFHLGFDTAVGMPDISAEIYDPTARQFGATGPMITNRFAHTATLLQDGSVLVTGGYTATGQSTAETEIYHRTQ